jgi:hypothetical protein
MKGSTTKSTDRWGWWLSAPAGVQMLAALAIMVTVWAVLVTAAARVGI